MYMRDYSASTISTILKEIVRQTSNLEEEDILKAKVLQAIEPCKTEQEALAVAMSVLKAQ